jgi:hypothetical protein
MLTYVIVIAVIFNAFLVLTHKEKRPQLARAVAPVYNPRRIKR